MGDTSRTRSLPAKVEITEIGSDGTRRTREYNLNPLRYGENPDQRGAVLEPAGREHAELLGRKAVSYNNEGDITNAFRIVESLDRCRPLLRTFGESREHVIAIIKHKTPAGLALSATQVEAYESAFLCDTEAAFGGIIATNAVFTKDTLEAIRAHEHFVEVICAPEFEDGVIELAAKREKSTIRFVPLQDLWQQRDTTLFQEFELRSLPGGRILLQDFDSDIFVPRKLDGRPWSVVSKREPSASECANMVVAWVAVQNTASNAVAYASEGMLRGIAGGQQKRSDAALFAGLRAEFNGQSLKGTSVATDGFWPFPDGIKRAAKYGATASISPEGGKKQQEAIDIADENNMAMVLTEKRTFRH